MFRQFSDFGLGPITSFKNDYKNNLENLWLKEDLRKKTMEEAIGCNSLILSMIDDELDNIWMKAEKPF